MLRYLVPVYHGFNLPTATSSLSQACPLLTLARDTARHRAEAARYVERGPGSGTPLSRCRTSVVLVRELRRSTVRALNGLLSLSLDDN